MRTPLRPVPEELKKLNKMKKYRTTDKHPQLKPGVQVMESKSVNDYFHFKGNCVFVNTVDFRVWLNDGYIEEIQEPEFTKDDMIDFANNYAAMDVGEGDLNRWLKEEKNEK